MTVVNQYPHKLPKNIHNERDIVKIRILKTCSRHCKKKITKKTK